jgi:type I restriction enzyme M protein
MAGGSGVGDGPNGAALFEAANKLRGSVESAEYKHLVLGLLFLKYISDASERRRQAFEASPCPSRRRRRR